MKAHLFQQGQGVHIKFRYLGEPDFGWVAGCRVRDSFHHDYLYWVAVPTFCLRPRHLGFWHLYGGQIIFPVPELWKKQFDFIVYLKHQIEKLPALEILKP